MPIWPLPQVTGRLFLGLACAGLAVPIAACDVAGVAASETPASCAATVSATLEGVARGVYTQAASGRAVAASTRRLARSSALSAAVARGDVRATRAALRPLLRTQIKRIVVMRAGRRLVSIGSGPALAPVAATIRDARGNPVGEYTLSVIRAAATAKLVHELTGAQVVIRDGATTLASPRGAAAVLAHSPQRYRVASFTGAGFPRNRASISLLTSRNPQARCASTTAQTTTNTLGVVARRLFRTESSGGRAHQVARLVARDPRFAHAVATADPAALRAQIVRFFQQPRLHVVRIRATTRAGRLINDVGGPYVLAPTSTTVQLHGRAIGRVTLSVQDDAGYIKLLHRFTGAEVILRSALGQVPGSTLPLRRALPTRGTISYRGRTYGVQTLHEKAFPSGPLAISVLVRQ